MGNHNRNHHHGHDADMSHPENHDWNRMYTGEASDQEPADALTVQIIDTLTPGRALDVGCGAGGLVAALAERGWQVSGIDVADKGIAAARKALAARQLSAELEVADAASWQPTASYDLITSTFALPGTRDAQRKVFAMMASALVPGGQVLIKDFDTGMKEVQPAFAAWYMPTLDDFREDFAGFEVLRAEIVTTPAHDHDGTGSNAGQRWTAALFHARKT